MKILITSDTHSDEAHIPAVLTDLVDDCDLLVHAGDFDSYGCYRAFADTGKLKAVYGNCDGEAIRNELSERLVFEAEGIRIGVIHRGALSLNDTTALHYLALEMDVDVLIFGHIHHPLIEKDGVLLICPGSPTSPRMSEPAVVEMNIENGEISARIINLPGRSCDYIAFSRGLDS